MELWEYGHWWFSGNQTRHRTRSLGAYTQVGKFTLKTLMETYTSNQDGIINTRFTLPPNITKKKNRNSTCNNRFQDTGCQAMRDSDPEGWETNTVSCVIELTLSRLHEQGLQWTPEVRRQSWGRAETEAASICRTEDQRRESCREGRISGEGPSNTHKSTYCWDRVILGKHRLKALEATVLSIHPGAYFHHPDWKICSSRGMGKSFLRTRQ